MGPKGERGGPGARVSVVYLSYSSALTCFLCTINNNRKSNKL